MIIADNVLLLMFSKNYFLFFFIQFMLTTYEYSAYPHILVVVLSVVQPYKAFQQSRHWCQFPPELPPNIQQGPGLLLYSQPQ